MADFGIEQFTDEDRAYRGSRFRDVVEALFANPYQRVWGGAGEPALPVYEVTLGSLARGSCRSDPRTCFARRPNGRSIRPPTCAGDRIERDSAACCTPTGSA